ncbi:TlpA disulfide reductase family protein [Segetibacter sp.]|jgi:thiol-disulfide isomerase/thioredoxin|uniref:TlpA family protein disulfide reductase n=1 Tax=Segetibacter sp. TaxID=2231182 RepID=UPI002603DFAB|nr:TlpA disulfide reductase family protein [Segetibacter sp.]MCW3081848.1 alkyl hydroperoxide reductase/Thiol specific antioxidant/Mal allergen [Segetibacter sp.]
MKGFVFISFLTIISSVCFCQKQHRRYDSLITTYNHLYNQPFPQLELEDTSGALIKTSSLLGKTVYVDFWFTTCPPCIKEIPYSKALQQYFEKDSNIVFLSICIENIDRKSEWKKMITEQGMGGVHLFYARNRPQKVNLLRKYEIAFPTYLLLNKETKVIGYSAPRPSETGWVHFAIEQAAKNNSLANSFKLSVKNPAVIAAYK